MIRNLQFCLLFIVIPIFIFSQNLRPRKHIKEIHTAMSEKAGAFIDVNAPQYPETAYNIEELVKKVLISSGINTCMIPNVTNVKITPNYASCDTYRAWGYFHKATTDFPFKEGLVISTGYAREAANSFEADLNNANGGGSDDDLAQVIGVMEDRLNDAAILEFDFVSTTSRIKFNYLIASEEYIDEYPCTFADTFAILLRLTSGGPYVNMPILPGGAGPVSITNIHPAILGSCEAKNEQYFAGYNVKNVETNFNGRTIPLTAVADVIVGQQYHFKMVIADYSDTSYDSAVFLEGGSFSIGVDLLDPTGIKLPSDINFCNDVYQVITASVNEPNFDYQWFYNGTPIPNATTNTITAVKPGTYTIEVNAPENPCPGTAFIRIHGGTNPLAQNEPCCCIVPQIIPLLI